MKHFSAFLAALFIVASASAQSLSLSQSLLELDLGEYLDYDELTMTNNGTSEIELGVSVDVACYDPTDALKIQICIGPQCFEPVNADQSWEGTETSPLLTIAPGETSGELSIHQFSYGTIGSEWVITFYDRNNPSDSVDLILHIDVCDQANSVAEVPELNVSAAYPNPASNEVRFDFDVNASPVNLKLFDLVGNAVKDVTLEAAQGTAKVDVSDLKNGVYFYSLTTGEHRSEVKSLVVSH
jgi:hypothetical protein